MHNIPNSKILKLLGTIRALKLRKKQRQAFKPAKIENLIKTGALKK